MHDTRTQKRLVWTLMCKILSPRSQCFFYSFNHRRVLLFLAKTAFSASVCASIRQSVVKTVTRSVIAAVLAPFRFVAAEIEPSRLGALVCIAFAILAIV